MSQPSIKSRGVAKRLLSVLALTAVFIVGIPLLPHAVEAAGDQPNVLVLIADDFGVESSVCYDGLPAPAPRLEAFCDEAVVFDNAWSSPICSPTRAGILTGRHSFRTGITEQVTGQNGLEIADDEYTLPRVLDLANSGYATANFGKWHLGGSNDKPNEMGWDHFSGLISGGVGNYTNWTKVTDGVTSNETTYATTANVNDALGWIGQQTEPWLTWIGFNAPHTPFHNPPGELHTQDLSAPSDLDQYHAAVEALDTEIGRLIDSLDAETSDNTVVIFMGDNGNPGAVSDFNRRQAKGSVYQGGIHVPLMVWGAGVEDGGRRSDALVGTIDIFATILELAGVDARTAVPANVEFDSRSFASVLDATSAGSNEYLLSSVSGEVTAAARAGTTIRDDRYKLIDFESGAEAFYDLVVDPTGGNPIAAADRTAAENAAYADLEAALATWTASADAPSPNPFPEFEVEPEVDVSAPVTSIDVVGDVGVGATVFSGVVEDDSGVRRVKVSLRNQDSGLWLQADGSLGSAWHSFKPTLSDPDAVTTFWEITLVTPEAGNYRLNAKATDIAGNTESPSVTENFDAG